MKGFYGDRSIAVLPFVNLSSDPEQQYFAEGISEEVLNLLARIRELRVISRSSAFTFKGQDLEIPEIAKRLDVGHVLEGSVRKAGNMVRVTAQLIEARTDTHLWSETYDRELKDIFAIQDEIAADVARNLHLALLNPLPRSRVTDPEVIGLTAQAKQLSERRDDEFGVSMEALLARALELDPDYLPALELMSLAVWFQADNGVITWDEQKIRAELLEERMRELDPAYPALVMFEAWDAANTDRDLEKAARLYEEAVTLAPMHSNLVRLAAQFGRYIGRMDDAIRLGSHAVAIDPLCYICLYQLSRTYLYAGEYTRAMEMRARYLRLGTGGNHHYALLMLLQSKYEEAINFVESKFDEGDSRVPEILVWGVKSMAYHSLGRAEESDEELAKILEMENRKEQLWILPDVYAWRGDNDELFEILFEESPEGGNEYSQLIFQPQYASMHSDPRWTEWRELIGMSEERLNTIQFSPQLPE